MVPSRDVASALCPDKFGWCNSGPITHDGLGTNADIYRDIVPRISAAAPNSILLVITDPPDPLADVARRVAVHSRVLSSGTFLDSLRVRFHLGQQLNVDPKSIEAHVIGEHGASQVYLWSTARIAGTNFAQSAAFRREVEQDKYGVTLSLPSLLGRHGVAEILMPALFDDEARGLDASAPTLREALQSIASD